MKKTLIGLVALASLAFVSACSDGGRKAVDNLANRLDDDKDEVYTGVLPAADCDGVRYTLRLDYDDDNPAKGDYKLVETYLVGDSVRAKALAKDSVSYKSEGDFDVVAGTGNYAANKYLKLVRDNKDSSEGSVAGPLYFQVASDSTLVLVNNDFSPAPDSGLNYTLKLVK